MISRRDGMCPPIGGKESKYCPEFIFWISRLRKDFFFFHAVLLQLECNRDSLRDVLDYINPSCDPRNLVDSALCLNATVLATFHLSAARVHPSDAQNGISTLKGEVKSVGRKVENFGPAYNLWLALFHVALQRKYFLWNHCIKAVDNHSWYSSYSPVSCKSE